MLSEYFFASREEASAECATRMESALRSSLRQNKSAAIVLSGGSSPADTLGKLSRANLSWDRVTLTLSDERWVAADHDDSNEKMLRETLLQNNAVSAKVLPLFCPDLEATAAPGRLQQKMSELALPFAGVLLGMGADGHFASLFPDFSGLEAALKPDNDNAFVAVKTAASPHERISMTLATILQSREILLLIFGNDKRQVYEDARKPDSALPVAKLLAQSRVPLRVIWAP
ncbi:MAG: 6-phosphogluconolactonase [Woeseia sp.]|nr:6-phosphogluconolactonase [Woeseia sp.]